MYIVVPKPSVENDMNGRAEIARASVEYAFRVLSKLTNKPLYSSRYSWMMKVPDKLGDMEAVRQFYKYEPQVIQTVNDIPPESEGVATYLKYGNPETVGYGLVTDTLDAHYVPYDLINVRSI